MTRRINLGNKVNVSWRQLHWKSEQWGKDRDWNVPPLQMDSWSIIGKFSTWEGRDGYIISFSSSKIEIFTEIMSMMSMKICWDDFASWSIVGVLWEYCDNMTICGGMILQVLQAGVYSGSIVGSSGGWIAFKGQTPRIERETSPSLSSSLSLLSLLFSLSSSSLSSFIACLKREPLSSLIELKEQCCHYRHCHHLMAISFRLRLEKGWQKCWHDLGVPPQLQNLNNQAFFFLSWM